MSVADIPSHKYAYRNAVGAGALGSEVVDDERTFFEERGRW